MWKEELEEILFSNDPSKINVEKAIDLKYSHTPSFLYKYKSFEDKYSLELLEKNKMWLSRPTNFNDPFDSNLKLAVKDMSKDYIMKVLIKPNWDNFKRNFNLKNKELGKIGRTEDPIHLLVKFIS